MPCFLGMRHAATPVLRSTGGGAACSEAPLKCSAHLVRVGVRVRVRVRVRARVRVRVQIRVSAQPPVRWLLAPAVAAPG